jgi:hypothetical protein
VPHQCLQFFDVLGAFDIKRNRSLATIVGVEADGIAIDEGRSPQTRIVAAVGFLHLDHVGAHVGQDHPGERPGERLADLDDLDAIQRSRHQRASRRARNDASFRLNS